MSDTDYCKSCPSIWQATWKLIAADNREGAPGVKDPGQARPVYVEHFYTLDALCARIVRLKANAPGPPMSRAPNEGTELENLLEAFRSEHLQEKDEARLKDLLLRDPMTLLVMGPYDAAPIKWPLHDIVCKRVRAFSPKPEQDGQVVRVQPAYKVATGDTILVKTKEVHALINAMLRRPLILLAGVSGSGKTQLAKRLGKAWAVGAFHGLPSTGGRLQTPPQGEMDVALVVRRLRAVGLLADGGSTDDGWTKVADIESAPTLKDRYAFTAVRSDWTEASHLWGYYVPVPTEAEGFYGTDTLRVFLHAYQEFHRVQNANQNGTGEQANPHFVLLDEMNLSRPEHFASDLLSAMEVRLGTDARCEIIELHKGGDQVHLREREASGPRVPNRIGWAPDLRVIGTVNVDETTFSFAPKVLDRAALLEFVDVDLAYVFSNRRYQGGKFDTIFEKHKSWFNTINELLAPHNLHLAYRATDEILRALQLAGESHHQEELDRQLCHKVLPRIRGSRPQVEAILKDIREKVCGSVLDGADKLMMKGKLPEPQGTTPWPMSIKKIDQMLLRAYTTGFTSYFG